MGSFESNIEEGRRDSHRVPQTDHGEASEVVRIQDMGDSRVRKSAGGSGNSVGDDLYREMTGNRDTVGGVTTNTRTVCKGKGLQMGWEQEGRLVAPRGDKETDLEHVGRNIEEC